MDNTEITFSCGQGRSGKLDDENKRLENLQERVWDVHIINQIKGSDPSSDRTPPIIAQSTAYNNQKTMDQDRNRVLCVYKLITLATSDIIYDHKPYQGKNSDIAFDQNYSASSSSFSSYFESRTSKGKDNTEEFSRQEKENRLMFERMYRKNDKRCSTYDVEWALYFVNEVGDILGMEEEKISLCQEYIRGLQYSNTVQLDILTTPVSSTETYDHIVVNNDHNFTNGDEKSSDEKGDYLLVDSRISTLQTLTNLLSEPSVPRKGWVILVFKYLLAGHISRGSYDSRARATYKKLVKILACVGGQKTTKELNLKYQGLNITWRDILYIEAEFATLYQKLIVDGDANAISEKGNGLSRYIKVALTAVGGGLLVMCSGALTASTSSVVYVLSNLCSTTATMTKVSEGVGVLLAYWGITPTTCISAAFAAAGAHAFGTKMNKRLSGVNEFHFVPLFPKVQKKKKRSNLSLRNSLAIANIQRETRDSKGNTAKLDSKELSNAREAEMIEGEEGEEEEELSIFSISKRRKKEKGLPVFICVPGWYRKEEDVRLQFGGGKDTVYKKRGKDEENKTDRKLKELNEARRVTEELIVEEDKEIDIIHIAKSEVVSEFQGDDQNKIQHSIAKNSNGTKNSKKGKTTEYICDGHMINNDQHSADKDFVDIDGVRSSSKTGQSRRKKTSSIVVNTSSTIDNDEAMGEEQNNNYNWWRDVIPYGEEHVLIWESDFLQELYYEIEHYLLAEATKFAWEEAIKHTAIHTVSNAAALPITMLNFAKRLDNPWAIAGDRAKLAGELLAEKLLLRPQGGRPVTLVGYGMGARVIFHALEHLAKKGEQNENHTLYHQFEEETLIQNPLEYCICDVFSPSPIVESISACGSSDMENEIANKKLSSSASSSQGEKSSNQQISSSMSHAPARSIDKAIMETDRGSHLDTGFTELCPTCGLIISSSPLSPNNSADKVNSKCKRSKISVSPSGLKVNKNSDSYIVSGIVENVVLLGTPIGCNPERWRSARSVVSGRFVNGYYPNDWVLALLFRAKSWSLQIAGINPVVLPPINRTLENMNTGEGKKKDKGEKELHGLASRKEEQQKQTEEKKNQNTHEICNRGEIHKDMQRQHVSELLDSDFISSPMQCSPQKNNSPERNHSKPSIAKADYILHNEESTFTFSNGGIENIDLTGIVKGHLHYPDVLFQIMKLIGLED